MRDELEAYRKAHWGLEAPFMQEYIKKIEATCPKEFEQERLELYIKHYLSTQDEKTSRKIEKLLKDFGNKDALHQSTLLKQYLDALIVPYKHGKLSDKAVSTLKKMMLTDDLTLTILQKVAAKCTVVELESLEKSIHQDFKKSTGFLSLDDMHFSVALHQYPGLFQKYFTGKGVDTQKVLQARILSETFDLLVSTDNEVGHPQYLTAMKNIDFMLSTLEDPVVLAKALKKAESKSPIAPAVVQAYASRLNIYNPKILSALLGEGVEKNTLIQLQAALFKKLNANEDRNPVLGNMQPILNETLKNAIEITVSPLKTSIIQAMNGVLNNKTKTEIKKDAKYRMMEEISTKFASTKNEDIEQIIALAKEFKQVASLQRGVKEPSYLKKLNQAIDDALASLSREKGPKPQSGDPLLDAMRAAMQSALGKKRSAFQIVKDTFQILGMSREEKLENMRRALKDYENATDPGNKQKAAEAFFKAVNTQRNLISGDLSSYAQAFNKKYEENYPSKDKNSTGPKIK